MITLNSIGSVYLNPDCLPGIDISSEVVDSSPGASNSQEILWK